MVCWANGTNNSKNNLIRFIQISQSDEDKYVHTNEMSSTSRTKNNKSNKSAN